MGTVEDVAARCVAMEDDGTLQYGQSRDEAIERLAKVLIERGVKHWGAQ